MLSTEQCYKIDPSLKNLSEEELLKIRDELYQLGQLALENWRSERGSKNPERSLLNVGDSVK